MSDQIVYSYQDETGKLLYQVVRQPGKDFKQRRPDGNDGWIPNLQGVKATLYQLPATIEAVQHGETVFVCEGEKDCNNLAKLALAVTTNSGGAGKWQDSFSDYLIGADVVILPDNDEPGRKHADKVARSLQGKAKSVQILELPGLPEKGDVSDWLKAGGTKEELLKMIAEAPEWKAQEQQPKELFTPITVRLSDVEPEEVSWLWEPYVPIGKLTILEGDPGIGKTFAALAMTAAVSTGAGLPGIDGRPGPGREPRNVIYMTAEDGLADTLRPRLDNIGADVSRVVALTGYTGYDDDGQETELPVTMKSITVLERALEEHEPALLVIDPLQAFLGAGVDMHRSNETRPVLAGVAALAEKHGCAVLLIRHLGKSQQDRAIYRGLGSIDFTAAARSVLLAGQDPDNSARRALIHTKSSLAETGASIGYEIRDGIFLWAGISELTAGQVLAPDQAEGETSALDEAKEFLRDILADGPVMTKLIEKQGRGAGISGPTLRRAKTDLKIKAIKQGDCWYWLLTIQDDHLDHVPGNLAAVSVEGRSSRRSYDHLDLDPGTLAGVRAQQDDQGDQESTVREIPEKTASDHVDFGEVRI